MPTLAERIIQRMGPVTGDLESSEGVSFMQVMRDVLGEECGDGWKVPIEEKPFPQAGAPKEEWAKVEGATKKWRLPDGSIVITNWIDLPEKVYCDFGFPDCWCRSKRIDPECKKSHGLAAAAAGGGSQK